jgi:hypothetical protein
VTGPPCGGKTTHVRDNRNGDDVVVDLDALAAALGYPRGQVEWDDDHPAVAAARMARAHVIHALTSGRLQATAWVIDAKPDRSSLAQYERAGAAVITIDPGREVCRSRAPGRPAGTLERIDAWYGDAPASGTEETDTAKDEAPSSSAPALGVFHRR